MNNKRTVLFASFFLSMLALNSCQEEASVDGVTIQVDISDIEIDSIFIAGSSELLGSWNPSEVRMDRREAGLVAIQLPNAEVGEILEFKFTGGDWSSEIAIEGIPSKSNIKLESPKDTVITFKAMGFVDSHPLPSLTGHLEVVEIPDFQGNGETRKIRIWTSTAEGPISTVLYMMDGQNLFDRSTSAAGGEWGVDEFIESHLDDYSGVAVVGIDNSPNRTSEYTDTETGERFRAWVVSDVIPQVEKEYVYLDESAERWIGGSSAGGTVALLFGRLHTHFFDGVLSFSPAVVVDWAGIDLIPLFESATELRIPIYLDMGGKGVDTVLLPGVFQLARTLDSQGWEKGKDYTLVVDSADDHNETAWNKRLPLAMEWLKNHQ